jgi:hypothetical protein
MKFRRHRKSWWHRQLDLELDPPDASGRTIYRFEPHSGHLVLVRSFLNGTTPHGGLAKSLCCERSRKPITVLQSA